MINALAYFCYPSVCFHCERPLLKNTGLCPFCFESLTLLDGGSQERSCGIKITNQGALFPNIDPIIELLERTLHQKHEKMIQWFSAMMVLQAGFLDFPWCNGLIFIPGYNMKTGLKKLWHEHLMHFFGVPMIHIPIAPEKLLENQTIYLIDWYLKPEQAYYPIIESLTHLYPQRFILLSIFDNKPFSNGA